VKQPSADSIFADRRNLVQDDVLRQRLAQIMAQHFPQTVQAGCLTFLAGNAWLRHQELGLVNSHAVPVHAHAHQHLWRL